MTAIARAWTHKPMKMSRLRPHRSDRAPVKSCPSAHTAGYRAVRVPMASTESPPRAKKRGNTPQANASFRLFTSPAWLHAESAGSLIDVRKNTWRIDPV